MKIWGYPASALDAWRAQLTISAAQIRNQPTFIAVIEEEIAGFYSLKPSPASWDLAHALETAARAGAVEVAVDADPNAEGFYLECGAVRRGEVAAPLVGQPKRVRPQLAFNL